MDQSPYLAQAIQSMSQQPSAPSSYGPGQGQLQAMARMAQVGGHTPGNGLAGLLDALRHGNLGAGAMAQPMGAPQQLPPPDTTGLMQPPTGLLKLGQQPY